jgi:4-amino-4-deoxy-L-arabinose transferase-like glycosyltransferase
MSALAPAHSPPRLLRWLFWAALLLRLWFVLTSHSPRDFVYSDMQSYHAVAVDLLLGRSSPWHAFRPVGYSFLLALLYTLSDGSGTFVGVVQALMGAALVPLTAELARHCGAGRRSQLACAAVVTFSVPLTLYCGLLLTEIPSCFFLLFALTRALRMADGSEGRAGLCWAGLALGAAVALRPNLLVLAPPLVLFVWRRAAGRLRSALLLAGCLAVPVICVSAYNSAALGRAVGPATNGGLNFYLNFADVRTLQYQGRYGGYWVSPVPNGFDHTRHELTSVPLFEERHYYRAGWQFVRAQPAALLDALGNFVEAAGVGRQLYRPNWPGHDLLLRRYAWAFFGLVLLPASGLLLALCWSATRRALTAPARLLAVCCVLGAIPMYFFLGDPRVRVPFDPLWVVLAGLAMERAAAWLRRWSHAGASAPTVPAPHDDPALE